LRQASTEQDSDSLAQLISRIIERLDAQAATPPESASPELMEEKTNFFSFEIKAGLPPSGVTVSNTLHMPMFSDVGTRKFKPFDMLAQQFTKVADSYKKAESAEQRRHLLSMMRLIIDEANILHRYYTDQHAENANRFLQFPEK
jgi:hypothetical protein